MYLALIHSEMRRVSSGTPAVAEELCRGALWRAEPIPPRLGKLCSEKVWIYADMRVRRPKWAFAPQSFLIFWNIKSIAIMLIFVISLGIPPAQNKRSSSQGSWMKCAVSFHILVFRCWMFRRLFYVFCSTNLRICVRIVVQNVTELVQQVTTIASRRGLGDVLGALGVLLGCPWGAKVVPTLDFHGFWLPIWLQFLMIFW